LSRFISRLGEKGLPLYRLLKKHECFYWTVEAQEALNKLKATLTHAPILTPPQNDETLYLYIIATTQVVSAVIVVERIEKGHALPVQRPVYYTQQPPLQIQPECWTLYFDGPMMKTRADAGLLFISPLGEHMRYVVRLHFPASNNMAEYETLLCGLLIAIETGIKRLDVRGDSQLVIDQVMKNASCRDDKMEAY
jgi:hypothetical protein